MLIMPFLVLDLGPLDGLNRGRATILREGLVIRTVLAGALLAAAFLFMNQPAKADWLCSANQCTWVTYDVVEPAYAVAWGAPVRPSCFWKQGFLGRWKMICP